MLSELINTRGFECNRNDVSVQFLLLAFLFCIYITLPLQATLHGSSLQHRMISLTEGCLQEEQSGVLLDNKISGSSGSVACETRGVSLFGERAHESSSSSLSSSFSSGASFLEASAAINQPSISHQSIISCSSIRQSAHCEDSITRGVCPQQLSMLHKYTSIRENSDRALMHCFHQLRASEEQASEKAGERALVSLEAFNGRVDVIERLRERRGSKVGSGVDNEGGHNQLLALEEELKRIRHRQKAKQDLRYKWFSCMLLTVGAVLFLRSAVGLHAETSLGSADAGMEHGERPLGVSGGFWGKASQTERDFVDWALFHLRYACSIFFICFVVTLYLCPYRMICTYINEDSTKSCSSTDSDALPTTPNYDFLNPLLGPSASAPLMYFLTTHLKRGLWAGLGRVLSSLLGVDPNWMNHTVLPCVFDVLLRLMPVWVVSRLCSFLLSLLGYSLAVAVAVIVSESLCM